MDKKTMRLRRATKARFKIADSGKARLSVHRTPRHIYAQIISQDGSQTLVYASSLTEEVKGSVKYTGNVEAAAQVGKLIATKAVEKGITEVAFDRSGFKYHGRVKSLADAARENGLKF